jgi:hypothetical protein
LTDPIRHEGSTRAGTLTIRPAHPYLDLLRSGAELVPVPEVWRSDRIPAGLDVKIVNNSARTVFFHTAQLDVAWSRPGIRPIPFVMPVSLDLCPYPSLRGPFFRCAGGPLTEAVLRFHLEHPRRPGAVTGEYVLLLDESGEVPWVRGLDNYAPLLQALAEAGAHPALGRAPFRPPREWEGRTHNRYWEPGLFENRVASLVGVLEYTESLDGAATGRASHRLRTALSLDVHYPQGPVAWRLMSPSATYQGLPLREEGVDYRVEVPISHVVAPGEADRILIMFDATRSSRHSLNLTLHHASGTLACGEVSLEICGQVKGR